MAPLEQLLAGAAESVLTPPRPMFLWGYPRVPRTSTGVHDDLLCSALFLSCGGEHALFLANDVIFVTKAMTAAVRQRISQRTGLDPARILVSATHTHSGPMTVRYLSNESDTVVPPLDEDLVACLVERVADAGARAVESARPASIAFAEADATGIGTNRHDPAGPSDLRVPCWLVRDDATRDTLALMSIVAMHPTVLHQDSTLVSGDFIGLARRALRESGLLPAGAPFVCHAGACGNQSPRHVTKANTLEEAARLGAILSRAIAASLAHPQWASTLALGVETREIDLALREFPDPADAARGLEAAEQLFQRLSREGAPRAAVRTAECDLFGAEETATLARAALDGRVAAYAAGSLPAEIQAFRLGERLLVAWPGEHFLEFALALKRALPAAEVATLANGELQGYIVTEEAARRGCYEAANALFAPANAARFLEASLDLARRLGEEPLAP